MNEKKIPLTIGITGHLNPRMRDTLALRDAVKRELTKLRTRCPHTPMVMLCSLAQGADLLCAEAAEEVGVSLRAVLPMEQAVYEKDFEPKDLARLRWQLERAQSVITIPAKAGEAEDKDRDALFRQAGLFITEHSHILLALWDGKTENQSDCGTAAMVDAAHQLPSVLPFLPCFYDSSAPRFLSKSLHNEARSNFKGRELYSFLDG